MTTTNWLSRAKAVAQVESLTPGGTIEVGDIFNVTINGKTVAYSAAGTTVASVTAGLAAALTAAGLTITEFGQITWADATTKVTGTGNTAGVPFIVTVTTTESNGGAADAQTFATSTTTAATGPNHWNDANNWDSGAVPVSTDTVNVNLSLGSVLYGLDQNAVTLTSLNIYTTNPTSNTLGLPKINAAGYTEYLDQYLKISATAWVIDANSPRVKVNFGSNVFSGEVRQTGQSQEGPPTPAVLLLGTHTSNTLDVVSGTVGLAYYYGEASAAATITNGPDGTLTLGAGVTAATTITSLGTLISNGAFTTLYTVGGQTTVNGAPGATTIDITGGTLICAISGTTTNVLVGPGTLDATKDTTARTFTNTTLRRDGSIVDLPNPTITYSNKVTRAAGVTTLAAA